LISTPDSVESDSLEIVQTFDGVTEISSPYTAILAECFQITSRIDVTTMQHCFRDANKVAHKLARIWFDNNTPVFLVLRSPSFITLDVTNDVSLFKVK
jgi:hypothetical protein